MEIKNWDDRVNFILKIKEYITENTDKFANNSQLQLLWGSLNRQILDLNAVKIDELLIKLNQEIYD